MKYICAKTPGSILLLTAKSALLCLLLMPTFAYSQQRVLAVLSNGGEIYQRFYSTLNIKSGNNLEIAKIKLSEVNSEILNSHDIVVSVGYKAAKALSKYKTKAKLIYSLIPDDELLKEKLNCANKDCYKVYINQPVKRYLELYKTLFPEGKNLVFVTTGERQQLLQKINILARVYDISYKIITVEKNEVVPRAFINNLNSNDVLLALPNPAIYNANNAKSIILTTYHVNVPIIAYSKSFAKAGSLVGLYSSIENIAEKTAVVVNKISEKEPLPGREFYPDDFMLEINTSVARSLNIKIDSVDDIKRKMK